MNQVLLVVDIQNEYFSGNFELVGSVEAAQKAALVIQHFREKGSPVIFIKHDGGSESSMFKTGSKACDIHELVAPLKDENIIEKKSPNSFLNTNLKEIIDLQDTKQLVIIGMMTHMCIDATTRAASDFGYDCTVVADACATKNLTFNGMTINANAVHASFMAALGSAYAKVISTEEYIGEENFNSATA